MRPFIVTFLGNRDVSCSAQVLKTLVSSMEELFVFDDCPIQRTRLVFYCGGYGQFSQIASQAIDILRKRYPEFQSKKVFVTPYITPSYQKTLNYMKQFYDSIVYPPLEAVPAKFAISRRNQWMIDECDMLITCIQYAYGNTGKCVEYAARKNKIILNIRENKAELLRIGDKNNKGEKSSLKIFAIFRKKLKNATQNSLTEIFR